MTTAKRLRVLQVTGTLYFGGAEKVVATLSKEIDRTRFEPAVCCTHMLGPLADVITAAGVPVMLANDGTHSAYLRPLDLRRAILRFRPDVVHSHGLQAIDAVGPLAICGQVPRWVHTFHFGNYPYSQRRYMLMERMFSRWADQLVAVAEPQRQSVIRHHKISQDRIVTLPNGVATNPFLNHPEVARRKREELGISPDALVVGTIAVLSEQKGLCYLIDAAQTVLAAVPSAKFLIAGDGGLADALKNQAIAKGLDSSIIFTGWRGDVAELMTAIDVYAMPSLWEAMPLALLEAMAARRPIVVTDVGDNRQMVGNGTAAILVPPRDPAALAAAVLDFARNPTRAREYGERAHEVFTSDYTVSRMVARYEAIYARDGAP